MRRILMLGMLLSCAMPAAAQTRALDECGRTASNAADVARCLQLAQRTASDEMLGMFQDVERRLIQRGPAPASDAAVAALRTSQRDFERYVEGQCGFVHDLAGGGALGVSAALACETDLLRQRTATLQSLLPRASAN